jgi:hypothetical protein
VHFHIGPRFGSYERIDETTPAQATRRKVSRTVIANTVSVPAAARSELRLTVEFSGVVQGVSRHISGRHFTIRRSGSGKQQTQYELSDSEVIMTSRAKGMRRIGTANATLATVSVAGVVGVSVLLAQQGTHHTATTPTAVTTTTQTTTPQGTVQQSTSTSTQHAVTSGS